MTVITGRKAGGCRRSCSEHYRPNATRHSGVLRSRHETTLGDLAEVSYIGELNGQLQLRWSAQTTQSRGVTQALSPSQAPVIRQ